MDRNLNLLRLEKINFVTDAREMTLIGQVISGLLTYPTEIKVAISEINKLINKIQRQHPETDINEFLETEQLPNGDVYYEMDFSALDTHLEFSELEQAYSFVQIRA